MTTSICSLVRMWRRQPENAVTQHCKGILKLGIPSAGGTQETRFITEGDVYRLIIRSKLPGAQRFEKWVFDEVLPEMRKKGMYITVDLLAQMKRNPDLIYEFVEKVLVHEPTKENGEREQEIEIYLKVFGKVEIPEAERTLEEIAEEEKLRKRRAKGREKARRYRERRKLKKESEGSSYAVKPTAGT